MDRGIYGPDSSLDLFSRTCTPCHEFIHPPSILTTQSYFLVMIEIDRGAHEFQLSLFVISACRITAHTYTCDLTAVNPRGNLHRNRPLDSCRSRQHLLLNRNLLLTVTLALPKPNRLWKKSSKAYCSVYRAEMIAVFIASQGERGGRMRLKRIWREAKCELVRRTKVLTQCAEMGFPFFESAGARYTCNFAVEA